MSKIAVIDIETTGLDPNTDTITCIGVYATDYQVVHRDLAAFVDDYMSGTLSQYIIVGHNLGFDIRFLLTHTSLTKEDLLNRWYSDTMSMAHIYSKKVTEKYLEWYEVQRRIENSKLPKGYGHRMAKGLSLKTLAPFFLKVSPFWEDPTNHDNDEYVLKDCKYTYDLYQYLSTNMTEEESDFYYSKAFKWEKMLFNTSFRGIEINPDIIDVAIEDYSKEVEGIYNKVKDQWSEPFAQFYKESKDALMLSYKEKTQTAIGKLKDKSKEESTKERYKKLYEKALKKADLNLNLDSSKNLAWLLRDYYNLDITDMNGKESTGKAVLKRLVDEGRTDVKNLLEYRKAKKILTSFLPSYKELAHNNVINASFNINGTRTGRLSCSSPNLQQQPPSMYKVFKPREGCTFLQYDYGSIEAVLIALYSEDPMLNTIVSKGGSLHNYNAKALFDLDCDPSEVPDKYPDERKIAKTIGFSVLYGAGRNRVKGAFAAAGIILTDAEADQKVKQLRKMFSVAKKFHREVTSIFESGDTVCNLLGRPISIPDPDDAYMKGFNTLIQSSASDLLLDATYKTTLEYKDRGIDAHPVAFVHDFIMIEVKKEQAEEADKLLVNNLLGYDLENKFGKIHLSVDGHIDTVWRK